MFPESLPHAAHAGHSARGWGEAEVPSAHTQSSTTGRKVTGQAEVRADTQEHILIHPQIFATTVPQQINTTTPQDQACMTRRPGGLAGRLKQDTLRITKEQPRHLNDQNQVWAKHQCKDCWALLRSK